jgi:hypothetical protein
MMRFWLSVLWSILALIQLIRLAFTGDMVDVSLELMDCIILGRLAGVWSLIYWWTFDIVGMLSKRDHG